jgi:hypothetical protein
MMRETDLRKVRMKHLVVAGAFFAVVSSLAVAAAPEGWFLAGSKRANYNAGVDQSETYNNVPGAFLQAQADLPGFGTLMKTVPAGNYLGERICLSAFIKSGNVTRWAGLWARVDGPGTPPKVLAFDNMQNRPIKGSNTWQRYEVVLDVPESAVEISFGVLLDGPGEVWINRTSLEIVTSAIPVTGSYK